MRKFYLFMLMAVGLLISTSMFAAPERPVLGQQDPQSAELRISPQGVEQLVPMATPQPKYSQSSLARAPHKAAMAGDVLKVVKPSGEEVFYDATNFNTVWSNLVAGDSIVLLGNIGTYWAYITVDNVTLDLNGHCLVSSYDGETSLSSQLYLLITTGNNIVIKNGYVWDNNYTFIYSDGKTYNNYGIEAWGGSLTLKNVTTDGEYWGSAYMIYAGNNATVEIKDCKINGCYKAIDNEGANVTISQSEDGETTIEGHYSNSILQGSGTITVKGGTIKNSYTWNVFTINGGTLNITGGNISNTSASAGYTCCIYPGSSSTINISGGEFHATDYITYNPAGAFTITGGKFYKPTNGSIFYDYSSNKNKTQVKGGWYNTTTALNVNLVTGYSFGKPVGDFYPVIKAVAQTADYGFASVEEALADADFDGTVKLIGNVDAVTINKDATLDLDIYSIGTLTVTDGAKVNIKGDATAHIGELIANKEDVILYGGNYDFQPSTKATLAEGLDERADYPSAGKYTVCQAAVASIFREGDTPQEVTYWTLQDAINDAQAGEKILINKDMSILNGVTVAKGKDIIIDLNGHVVTGQHNPTGPNSWQLVMNNGTLTLMDNTDVNKDGTGKGKLSTANFHTADLSFNPTYGIYVVNNAGNLTIESGLIESFGVGYATYCVQHGQGAHTTTINGGKLVSLKTSYSIRIYDPQTLDNKFYINGGIIESLWVQGGSKSKFTLHIQNATILDRLGIDIAGSTDFDILLKNIVMTNHLTLTGDARTAYAAGKYVVDSVKISGYNLSANTGDAAFKHLKNGIYQFEDVYTDAAYASSNWREKYPEEEGYFAVPHPTNPAVVEIYKTGQANIRAFMPYIMDGYGLVCIDEENKWYEIRPLQGTTGDETVDGHDGELGNPWHQDGTWDFTETNVVPKDTTPVHIDHDVYVETTTKADAASIIVEPEQTLTIQEGATLIVGAGGIVFNNEEDKTPGKIVVEPGATLLDGANGIISEDTRNIIIQASETAQGTFLFDPEVSLNTHPFGTVELISRSGLRKYPNGNLVNYWHRFASPVVELTEENFTNNWEIYSDTAKLQIAAGTYFQTQIFQWSTKIYDWQRIDNKDNYCDSIVPFQGYTMLNNCTWDNTHKGGVTYTFKGNLVGNHNDDLSFLCKGYNYFGNSYTAPINIKELLNAVDNDDINRTVYIWDAELQVFRGWSFEQLLYVDDETTPASIPSMQTFVMQLLNGNSAVSQIDYVNAIWNPVVNAVTSNKAPQKAQQVLDATLKINITAANGEKDAVVMMKDGRYSNELDNGADAEKYMNNGSVNFYAHADFANVSTMADTEIEGTMLSLVSNDETEFIMTFSAVSGDQYAIRDNLTGSLITIAEGNAYAFSTNANSTDENRFEIVALHRAPTDVENINSNAAVKGIYSVTGQYLGEAQDWFKLPAGVYVMDGQKVVK